MEPVTFQITCQGATTVLIDELDELSELHHFKRFTDEDYIRLRNSFTDPEVGFTYAVSYWVDENGKKWTVDGRSRLRTVRRMRDEGFVIPPLPADIIFAPSKKVAAKRIIASESKAGDIVENDFTDFLAENDIKWEEVDDWANIPDLGTTEEKEHASDGGSKKEYECPACHTKFVPD